MAKAMGKHPYARLGWPIGRGGSTRWVAVLASAAAVITITALVFSGLRALAPREPTVVIALPMAHEAGSIGLDRSGARVIVAGRAPSRSVTILDTSTYTIIRSVQVAGGITAAVIARRLGLAAILSDGSSRCIITLIALRDGSIMQHLAAPSGCHSAMIDESLGWIYVLSTGPVTPAAVPLGPGRLVAYDLHTGVRRITALVGLDPWAGAIDTRTHHVFVANLQSNTVSVINEHSGHVVRTVAVGSQPHAVVADEQTGRVFVANGAGNIISANTISMLDARNGTVLGTIPTGPLSFVSAFAVSRAQRLVVMADGGGAVLALDATTGAQLYRVKVAGLPGAIAIDERHGRLVVTGTGTPLARGLHFFGHGQLSWAGENGGNGVSILATRDGRILTTYQGSPTGPEGVVVDEGTGRVFAVNTATNAVDILGTGSP